jgi:hypothetical protein
MQIRGATFQAVVRSFVVLIPYARFGEYIRYACMHVCMNMPVLVDIVCMYTCACASSFFLSSGPLVWSPYFFVRGWVNPTHVGESVWECVCVCLCVRTHLWSEVWCIHHMCVCMCGRERENTLVKWCLFFCGTLHTYMHTYTKETHTNFDTARRAMSIHAYIHTYIHIRDYH